MTTEPFFPAAVSLAPSQQPSVTQRPTPDVPPKNPQRPGNRLGDHYLMLVNTAMAKQVDEQELAQFDLSPYDGLAVSFAAAYDTSTALSPSAMQAREASWKISTRKDIWPWVYLNRTIGANDAERNPLSKVPYFERFQGLDLDGKAGAQSDFLENWRNAFRLAKTTRVPGIVCDLEFYNNYKAYDIGELASMTSTSREEVIHLLRRLGAAMADDGARQYEGAVIWFLFTGFTRVDYRIIDGQPYYLAATYIVQGLLDEIQEKHLPLRVLAGGETGLGYCHTSLDDLRQAIAKRADIFGPLLSKYGGVLELAGTMTLWSDRAAKKNWVAQGACGASPAGTVEDLIPYMELLFKSYRYNWIYGSPNGGYLAFQPDIAARFDAAIARAKEAAFGSAAGPFPPEH